MAQLTEIRHHHCQTGGRGDQTDGKETRLTELLVCALGRDTGQDSTLNCLYSDTHQQLHSTTVTHTTGNSKGVSIYLSHDLFVMPLLQCSCVLARFVHVVIVLPAIGHGSMTIVIVIQLQLITVN